MKAIRTPVARTIWCPVFYTLYSLFNFVTQKFTNPVPPLLLRWKELPDAVLPQIYKFQLPFLRLSHDIRPGKSALDISSPSLPISRSGTCRL